MTETSRRGCIQSPLTGNYMCDCAAVVRTGGDYAGLDNAYRDSVRNGVQPCRECVRTAALAMGVEL